METISVFEADINRNGKMVSDIQTFLKESKAELAKVTWPDRKTTMASTVVVVVVSLIVGAYLGVLDVALSKVFEFIFQ